MATLAVFHVILVELFFPFPCVFEDYRWSVDIFISYRKLFICQKSMFYLVDEKS